MSTNVVNLDALIPRQDFAVDNLQHRAPQSVEKITIVHLDGHYFGTDLRKPDFQRETVQWTPDKVVDLIRSFLDADLIPAVILWRAGRYIFVIDGAHRLSALLAWIYDDYGDKKRSLEFFGGVIPPEQKSVAERTRDAVKKVVGAYSDYAVYRNNRDSAPPEMQERLNNLADNSLIAQWVTATDEKTAQDSFFKINQQGTPIDPTEKRLLLSRTSANAIAARAITHAGTGHKYWSAYAMDKQKEIESLSAAIHEVLYNPSMGANALTTLDVPVAGRGYNALPFIFDLVNQTNKQKIPDTSRKKVITDTLPRDEDGKVTISFLRTVKKAIGTITGDQSQSLGLHPVVYFYTRSGTFQPSAFLATLMFLDGLETRRRTVEFTKHRRAFEEFLTEHKEAMSLIVHRYGSGERSVPWIAKYYDSILDGLLGGKSLVDIHASFGANSDFMFLVAPRRSGGHPPSTKEKRSFNTNTKTATFFAAALPNGARCALCGALAHRNSLQTDHIILRRNAGPADASNAQISHPYRNSVKDQITGYRRSSDVAAPAQSQSS